MRNVFGSFEDGLQEAALVWCRLIRRMERDARVDNAAWMMSLYKITLHRAIHNWAVQDTRQRHVVVPSREVAPPEEAEDTALLLQIGLDMSAALEQVVQFLAAAPTEVLEHIWSGSPADINRRLLRWSRVTGKPDVYTELRAALEEAVQC